MHTQTTVSRSLRYGFVTLVCAMLFWRAHGSAADRQTLRGQAPLRWRG